jgi:hypothetical protein
MSSEINLSLFLSHFSPDPKNNYLNSAFVGCALVSGRISSHSDRNGHCLHKASLLLEPMLPKKRVLLSRQRALQGPVESAEAV